MTRVIGVLATSLVLAGAAFGQSLAPTSDVFTNFIQSGGVPYRTISSFYVPQGFQYVVDYYGQCGGLGSACNPLTSDACVDAIFAGATCPSGFTCQRQNAQYWQCVQAPLTYPPVPATVTLLQPYAQCGGVPPFNSTIQVDANGRFLNVACPQGFGCLYSNPTYSVCSPNPVVVPQQQQEQPLSQLAQSLFGIGGQALAPGVYQYDFTVPGGNQQNSLHLAGGQVVAAPPKPVELVLNATRIGEFFDSLLQNSPPPPGAPAPGAPAPRTPAPAPGVLPPAPGPSPPTQTFTVPDVDFGQAPEPVTIGDVTSSTVGRKLLQTQTYKSLVTKSTNTPVALHGFNWFGFETGDTMVQGLTPNYADTRNFSQVGDFATVVYRQQALGFNAVRLPFRFGDLQLTPKNQTQACSADSLAQIKGNLTDPLAPYNTPTSTGKPFPAQKAPLRSGNVTTTGLCNSYLPNDSTLNRFLYVIQFYIANGFYVAIDYHGGQGQIETDRQIVSNPAIFQQNWAALLSAIQSLPTYNQYLKGRIFFDLLNEPDAWNMTWSSPNINLNGQNQNSSTVPAWGDLYTTTASALLRQEPNLLFFAEGCGQKNQPGTAFGMGFGINSAIYDNRDGLYNALGGLQTLAANAAVKNATIITPHIYGDSTTGWTNGEGNTNLGNPGLPFTYYNNFAYLSVTGLPLASGGNNVTFPILIGEFGTVFNSSQNATNTQVNTIFDDRWIHDLALFDNNFNQTTNTVYPHAKIDSSFYWAWNGNQFQALGLVNADANGGSGQPPPPNYSGPLSPGWLTIQWVKINNLTAAGSPYYTPDAAQATGGGFGLIPWYY